MSIELARVLADFERHGPTDVDYLRLHFGRFMATKEIFEATWGARRGRVLDIGAHWLHQSYLYACDGYEVTAADVPSTLETDAVRRLACSSGIHLLPYHDLANGRAFTQLEDDSFDVILFTEIIEHLAFNPVALWGEVHRILRPGGRVVVTTPNYLALRTMLRRWRRQLVRPSGGLSVEQIIRTPTHGHHWKEYTLAELGAYFSLLSPDFVTHKALHVRDYYRSPSWRARAARIVEEAAPVLRPNLHLEIELAEKRHGVMEEPGRY
jgi:2-polyprenyl-3-methyl-5-hydroxy-6-metoxy-1,4-benzoquinol methylase